MSNYTKKVDLKKLEQKIYDNPNMFKPKINKNYKGIKPSAKDDNNNKDKDKNKNQKKMAEYASLTFEERQKNLRKWSKKKEVNY